MNSMEHMHHMDSMSDHDHANHEAGMHHHDSGSMAMAFTSWSDFHTTVVFTFWEIHHWSELATSFMAIVGLAVVLQGLKYHIARYEDTLRGNKDRISIDTNQDILKKNSSLSRSNRLIHAGLQMLSYALALFLMLVAMTFNPWLFVALVLGYGLGDYLFYVKHLQLHSSKSDDCS